MARLSAAMLVLCALYDTFTGAPERARSTSVSFDFGQFRLQPISTSANFDFGQLAEVELSEVELAEVEHPPHSESLAFVKKKRRFRCSIPHLRVADVHHRFQLSLNSRRRQ